MNFRGRCHPDMFHSDHQQINKKRQKKTKWTNTLNKNFQVSTVLSLYIIIQKTSNFQA